jgi:hypothetical protein
MSNGHDKKSKSAAFPRPEAPIAIPVGDIYFNKDWNSREARRYEVADDRVGNIADFAAGMREEGQRTPIDVRPNPWRSKEHPQPWTAVTGFRRGTAVELIAAAFAAEQAEAAKSERRDPKNLAEAGQVLAFAHERMTEEDAVTLNAIENLDRLDLEAADIAFAVWRVWDATPDGPGKTHSAVARRMGLSQTYVTDLVNIKEKVIEDLRTAWRRADEPRHPLNPTGEMLTVPEMLEVAKEEPGAMQIAKFQSLLAGKKKTPKGPGSWIVKACERAGEIGALLGSLHRTRHVNADKIEWHGALFGDRPGDPSPCNIKWHKDVSEASESGGLAEKAKEYRAKLVAAAVEAFAKAVKEPERPAAAADASGFFRCN